MSAKAKPGMIGQFLNSANTWLPWKVAVKYKQAKCVNCVVKTAKAAEVYCVDCQKELCKFCATLLHHPETKAEKHSLEDIVQKKDGVKPEVKILSPILLDIILVAAVYFLLSGSGIREDYFQGASYCPGLGRVRWWVARFDANVFFYFKNELAHYCDFEDSYWRFFTDTWVRSILTSTDSPILLVGSFVKAILFEEFLRIIITPVIAYLYAVLAYLVRSCEFYLHTILYTSLEDSNHTVTKWLQLISAIVQKIHFAEKFGISAAKKPSPPTYQRKRPAEDMGEYLTYMWRRRFRLLEFYKAQAQTVCNVLLKGSLAVSVLVRIFCLMFGGQIFVSLARLLGFGDRADRHKEWFISTTGIVANDGSGYISDWMASFALRQILAGIPLVKSLMGEVTWAAGGSVDEFVPVLIKLWPVLLLIALRLGWWRMVVRQKAAFAKNWKDYKKELWGSMSRDNPCDGYKELQFSDVPAPTNGKSVSRSFDTVTG